MNRKTQPIALSVLGVLLTALLAAAAPADLPLVDAVKAGDVATVRALVAQGIDVNAAEVDGTTPLHWAAYGQGAEIARLLLAAGAGVNVGNRYGVRPLSLACVDGNAPVIAALLDAGANPNTSLMEGETAVMTAARSGNVEAVELLLDPRPGMSPVSPPSFTGSRLMSPGVGKTPS